MTIKHRILACLLLTALFFAGLGALRQWGALRGASDAVLPGRGVAASGPESPAAEEPRDVRSVVLSPAVAKTRSILVTDAAGDPVSSARLHRRSEDGWEPEVLGITDPLGVLEWAFPSGEATQVLVKAQEFETQSVELPAEFEQYTVVLQVGGTIRGQVVDPQGMPVGPDVAVFAWPTSSYSNGRAEISRALRGDPSTSLSLTDDAGQFALEGLELAAKYHLVAGGRGMSTRELEGAVASSDAFCVLRVHWIYGTRIVAEDQSGQAVRPFASNVPPSRWRVETADPDAQAVVLPAPCFSLLGIAGQSSEPASRLCLFSASTRVEWVGPNHVSLHVPGYQPVEAEFESIPLAEGMNALELQLVQTAAAFGGLDVRFEFQGAADTLADVPEGSLVLTAPGERPLHLGIRPGPSGPLSFQGLPTGTYQVHFQAETSFARAPADGSVTVEIMDGASSMVVLPMPGLGSIRVEARSADGIVYGGPLTLNLGIGPPKVITVARSIGNFVLDPGSISYGPTTSHHFQKPPYVLRGLASGVYAVASIERFATGSPAIDWPAGLPPARTMPAVVTVEPGRQVDCRFILAQE